MRFKMRERIFSKSENEINLFARIVNGYPHNYLNSFCIRLVYSWNFHLDCEYVDILLPIQKGATLEDVKNHLIDIDEFASILNDKSQNLFGNEKLQSWSSFGAHFGNTDIPLKYRSDPAFDKWGGLCKEVTVGNLYILSLIYFDSNGKRYDLAPEKYEWKNSKQNPLSVHRC